MSILLPVLGKVRAQANQVACTAQMRSLVQLIQVYSAQNKGSLPWGFAWERMNADGTCDTTKTTYTYVNGSNSWPNRYTWYTLINALAVKDAYAGVWPNQQQTAPSTALVNQVPKLTKAFVCPEVATDPYMMNYTTVTYGFNMAAMPNQSYEINTNVVAFSGCLPTGTVAPFGSATPPNPVGPGNGIGPARQGQLYGDTALLWDQQLWVTTSSSSYRPQNVQGEFAYTGIDSGQLLYPQRYRKRYRGKSKSPLPECIDSNPIRFPTFAHEIEVSATIKWSKDLTGSTYVTPFNPGVRFRHRRDTVCNVAFADGSVRPMTVNQGKVAYVDSLGQEVAQNDFLRSYLKLKAPSTLKNQVETE